MTHRRVQTFCIIIMCLLFAGSASADVDVQRLTLARNGIFTELTVHVPGHLLSNHFMEEPQDGRPFRVVLDFSGAVHQLGQLNFENLPSAFVTRIRTSQYTTTPQNVVRVVLDLVREVTYKVSTTPESVVISLVAPAESDFASWTSSPLAPGPALAGQLPVMKSDTPVGGPKTKNVAGTVTEQKPAEKGKVVAVVPPQESSAEAWQASRPALTSSPAPEQVWASAPQIKIEKPATSEPPADVGEPAVESEADEVDAVPVVESQEKYAAVVQYDTPIGPEWQQEPPPKSAIAETPAVAQAEMPQDAEATGKDAVTGTETAPAIEEPPVQAQEPVEPTASASDANEKLPLLARLKSKFFGSPGEEQVTSDASVDSSALARIKALASVADDVANEDQISSDSEQTPSATRHIDRQELESKIATVDPAAVTLHAATAEGQVGGERNRETSWKGTPVRTDADRRKITYERFGRRDPFDPLIEGQRSGLWTTALPRVDALRLVGILEDYGGTVALFEDMEGYGYVLHEGDPVKHGHVKAIGENRVIFQIDDYGWVHTVVLELQRDASESMPGMATEYDDE